ncbi:MAG: competence/damage-inducible protein A [Bacteroidetes bacterium]|nr:competence/damage-inducible protein A [Bacteroidota bacterium]
MNAEILSIGDELLIGQVTNTNASYLGEQLSLLGITVRRVSTVGDRIDDLLDAFARAWNEHDVIITTGGLGPTHDDITREAVCRFFDTGLVENAEVLADIKRLLLERKRPLSASNRDQAMVPAAAGIIRNTNGTAPGYHFHRDGKHLFVTPGVPYEMHGMMESYILPHLREQFTQARASLTILTTGIAESTLADTLQGLESLHPSCSVAYLPSPIGVRVRLTALADDETFARARLAELRTFISDRAEEYVYGVDRETIEQNLGEMLISRSATVAVAESCTGGLVTDRITNVPGSSRWFERGVVCYSNESKTALLGVDPAIIASHGAVSRQTAEAMANGIRRTAGTAFGLSTTGIAGPDGGSAEKPVGLVWIGISSDAGSFAFDFHFGSDRVRTKQRAAQAALDILRRALMRLPLQPTSARSTT